MKIIELVIDENGGALGVDAMSVVESPAIEKGFVMLKDQKLKQYDVKLEMDEEKHLLLGPALIPNKLIYRKDPQNGEYYIHFSKKTVEKASEMFLELNNQSNATLEHEKAVEGLTVVQSWIVDDKQKDKTALHGIDVPVGTWMIATKVKNEEIWNLAKTGEIKGFSIEAYFADKMEVRQSTVLDEIETILNGDSKI